MIKKNIQANKRKLRSRAKLKKVIGEKLRLSPFISNKNIYVQLIDDSKSSTLASSSTLDKKLFPEKGNKSNKESAVKIGKALRDKFDSLKIDKHVVLDRGHYKFHGIIKALMDSYLNK